MLGSFAKNIFERTYAHDTPDGKETWEQTAHRVTKHVMRAVGVDMRQGLAKEIREAIVTRKFIPAGRYLYASGRPLHQVCNCLMLRAHDSREGWSELMAKASKALMTGAGIGVNYSGIRHEGALIRKSGGVASGPIPLMQMVNECGRGVMQGGVRRCLPGYAPVVMWDLSRKPIKDIEVGDLVYTRFGPKKVLATSCEGKQKLLKIITSCGEVICSYNHRWLGTTKTSFSKWLTAKNIEPGWYLYFRGMANTEYDKVPARVLKVVEYGDDVTYDIEVEDHEFIAYNHISHNSAIWAGLNWQHPDIYKFINIKNWPSEIHALKEKDFSFPATLDHTNISVGLDDMFFEAYNDDEHPQHAMAHSVYWAIIEQMLRTGEPGFSVDVGKNAGEDLANACTEVRSRDSDDICDLGSVNLSKIDTIDDLKHIIDIGAAFLLAGSVYTDVPYSDVDKVLSKNRRLGLGLMGIHEWLLKRGKQYGPDEELGRWLKAYSKSGKYANKWADEWNLNRPKKTRAIAPNGTTSIVAETTGGIEPVFCVAYKRRYMKGNKHCYQYVVDPCAKRLIEQGIDPHMIEDAYMLARDVERRVAFQAWIQQFVDHAISSTINLPAWGSEFNNKDLVRPFGSMLIRYLPQLRGITTYPDGSRGGQPLNPVSYDEANGQEGVEVVEEQQNVCDLRGGSCGD